MNIGTQLKMNSTLRKFPIFLTIITLMVVVSCQKESEEFINETQEQDQDQDSSAIDASLTAVLISASQNNGYKDNIIDGSSCISIKLPVNIIANDQKLTLETEADYGLVEAIFEEFTNDVDFVEIQFPITIVFEQYNEIGVTNATVFNSIVNACQNGIPDTYSCADFVYPISCFTYNTTSEQTGLVRLTTDKEWFDYLNYLEDDLLISIDYPMGVVIDNEVTRVTTNNELRTLMSEVNCDAENGIIDPVVFQNKLTTSLWYVNLFNENGADKTCSYVAYHFRFNADGTVDAKSDFDIRNGSWELRSKNGDLIVAMEFEPTGGNDAFELLNSSWEVSESNAQTIKLKDNNNGNGIIDYLYFGRSATTSCGSGNVQILTTNLIDGSWGVQTYFDNGENETDNYEDYELTFELGGAVVARGGVYNLYGSWDIIGDTELQLVLDFGTQFPFSEFNAAWDVLSFDPTTVSLQNTIGGTNELTLEKL